MSQLLPCFQNHVPRQILKKENSFFSKPSGYSERISSGATTNFQYNCIGFNIKQVNHILSDGIFIFIKALEKPVDSVVVKFFSNFIVFFSSFLFNYAYLIG